MKRELNETEKPLCQAGIKKRNKEIKELNESLEIYSYQKEFQLAQRKYEDFIKPYNRKVEDANQKIIIESKQSDLDIATKDLENLKSQLKEGVTVKTAVGVN